MKKTAIKRQEYVKIHLSGIKLRKLDGRRKIMEMLLYLVPVFGILGLLFAAYLAARVGRQDAGNDRMKEIAAAINIYKRRAYRKKYRQHCSGGSRCRLSHLHTDAVF